MATATYKQVMHVYYKISASMYLMYVLLLVVPSARAINDTQRTPSTPTHTRDNLNIGSQFFEEISDHVAKNRSIIFPTNDFIIHNSGEYLINPEYVTISKHFSLGDILILETKLASITNSYESHCRYLKALGKTHNTRQRISNWILQQEKFQSTESARSFCNQIEAKLPEIRTEGDLYKAQELFGDRTTFFFADTIFDRNFSSFKFVSDNSDIRETSFVKATLDNRGINIFSNDSYSKHMLIYIINAIPRDKTKIIHFLHNREVHWYASIQERNISTICVLKNNTSMNDQIESLHQTCKRNVQDISKMIENAKNLLRTLIPIGGSNSTRLKRHSINLQFCLFGCKVMTDYSLPGETIKSINDNFNSIKEYVQLQRELQNKRREAL